MIDFLGPIVTTALMVVVINALEIGRSAKLALATTCGLWIGLAAAASASGWLTISDPFPIIGIFVAVPLVAVAIAAAWPPARAAAIAWGIVAAQYIWPELRDQPRAQALRPLLVLHSFRFIGLAFLVPGVVSLELSAAFAHLAAYGDLLAAVLAVLALAGLQTKPGLLLVWVFNLWGTADLLYAFYQGNSVGMLPGQLGAAFSYRPSLCRCS